MKQSLGQLKRLYHYISPYKVGFIGALFLAIIAVVMNALMPFVTGLPTTRIAQNIKNGESLDFNYIFKVLVILFIIGLVYSSASFLAQWFMTQVVQKSMKDLRTDISQKINRLPVSYFDTHQFGDVLSRVTNDVDAVSNALQQGLIAIVNALLGITMAVVAMLTINVKLALLVMLIIPLSLVISRLVVRWSQPYFKRQQDSLGELNGFVQENLTGFNVLKLYGREEETITDFKEVNQRLTTNGFKAAAISGLMMPLVNLTAYSAYIGVAVLGSFYVISGTLLLGNLQAFIQYVWQVSQPMGQITQLSSMLQSASAATKRVFTILDEPESFENDTDIALPEVIRGDVEFDNVSFS